MRDARRLQLLAIVAALLATMAAWALAPAMATTPAEALVPEGSESAPAAATAPGVARSDADEPSWLLPFLGRPEADRVRALAAGERGGSGLRGRLVARWLHQPWQPLADVEVLLTSSWLDTVLPLHVGDAEEPLPPLYGPRTRTDAQGGFSFRIAVESDELFLLIGRGTEWHEFRKARHLPRAGETVDLGTIYLDERGSVTGSVVDAANQPVADVEVRAVDAPLLDPDLDQRELRELRSAGLERFKPRGFFADAPLPRWVAQRDQLLPFPRTRSGADGQFVLPGLRATSHDLFLSGGELAGSVHEVLVRGGERTDLGRIRLVGGRPVSGIVIDEQQRPWIGARVTAIDDDFALGPAAVPVDWHGNFVLRGLAQQRPGTLLFQHPAGGPWLPIGKLTPERREPGRFVVDAPQTMRFRIVDQTRAALPQAEVRAFVVAGGLRPQDMLLPPFFQPQREADGSFRLRQMSGATTVLVATAGGFAPGIGRAPPDQGTILLLPAVRMRVRTVDVAGAPVADAKVIAQLQRHPTLDFPGAQWDLLANDRAVLGRTDAAGVLLLPDMVPTMVTLAAEHPDFVRSTAPAGIAAMGREVSILMRRPAMLRGVVTLEHTAVGAGYQIAVDNGFAAGHPMHGNPFLRRQVAVTGDDGSFTLPGFTPGIWRLLALDPKTDPFADDQPSEHWLPTAVQLGDGEDRYVELEVQHRMLDLLRLFGQVHTDGLGVAAAMLRLRPAIAPGLRPYIDEMEPERRRTLLSERYPERLQADPWSFRTLTDAQGSYAIGGLFDDDYELRIDVLLQGRYQRLLQTEVELGGRNRRALLRRDFELRTGSVRLWFQGDGRALADRVVRLRQRTARPDSGAEITLLTDDRGGIELAGVPAGTYQVELAHGNEQLQNPWLELHPGDLLTATFVTRR